MPYAGGRQSWLSSCEQFFSIRLPLNLRCRLPHLGYLGCDHELVLSLPYLCIRYFSHFSDLVQARKDAGRILDNPFGCIGIGFVRSPYERYFLRLLYSWAAEACYAACSYAMAVGIDELSDYQLRYRIRRTLRTDVFSLGFPLNPYRTNGVLVLH